MDDSSARTFLAEHTRGVLITLRADGRPQSSNILYRFDGEVARVSVTDDRAKTANLRRDPRAVLHVSSPSFWQYVSASVTAELSAVTTGPGDAVATELLELYDSLADEPHADPDGFQRAMADERRLVLRLRPDGFAGMV